MSKTRPVLFGKSFSGDFRKNTLEFKIDGEFSIQAGEVVILDRQVYDELIVAMKGIRNSMRVHPDCESNSEFECMVDRCDEVMAKLEKIKV